MMAVEDIAAIDVRSFYFKLANLFDSRVSCLNIDTHWIGLLGLCVGHVDNEPF